MHNLNNKAAVNLNNKALQSMKDSGYSGRQQAQEAADAPTLEQRIDIAETRLDVLESTLRAACGLIDKLLKG